MSQLSHTNNARRTAASPDLLVFPGQPGGDDARRAWNLSVDQPPAAVALPETVDDVIAAVDHARAVGLSVAVQGTGHGAGSTPLEGALLMLVSGAGRSSAAVLGGTIEYSKSGGIAGIDESMKIDDPEKIEQLIKDKK